MLSFPHPVPKSNAMKKCIGSGVVLPRICAVILWLASISTAFSQATAGAPASPPTNADATQTASIDAVMRVDGAGKEMQPYRVKVNDKEYNFVGLLKLRPSDTAGAQIEVTVPFKFTHPGELNDLDEMNFIKEKIQEEKEPWASEFLRLKNSNFAKPSYLDKMAHPPSVISSGFSGAHAIGAFEEMRDANAAYAQALMFYFTGDKTYAHNAESILETYAATVTSHQGLNWYLLVSWAGSVFPVAADLLHATDPDWKNDRVIAKWFNDVFLPPLHDRLAFGNRELAVINAVGAIGVYNEDPAAFYEACNHWVNYVPEYYYLTEDGPAPRLMNYWTPEITTSDDFLKQLDSATFSKDWQWWIDQANQNYSVDKRRGKLGDDSTALNKTVKTNDPSVPWTGAPGTYVNGYTAENGRDLGHVEVAFASTINFAEIAWHQGIDLYASSAKRLTTFMESLSALRLGEDPPASVTVPLKALGMGQVWEMAYDHYHNLLGMDLPNTTKLLETVIRPAKDNRMYSIDQSAAGHDPDHPRLWKFPPPFPSLFATVITEGDGWVSSYQSLTHRDLHAH